MIRTQEKILIKRCLKHDRLAQKALYDEYSAAMFSTAYRLTKDFDLSHDVLQDAFIKVFQSLKSYRGDGVLGGWIKTIVVRTALRNIRGLHMHLELSDELVDSGIRFDENLTGELLEQLILELPDRCRVIFDLIEVEGYKHHEVAEMLGVSVGTTKSQLHYAKKILKGKLVNKGYERRKKG